MQTKQVQDSIKLKNIEACGESFCNDDHYCKNWVMHATLDKDNEKHKTTLRQAKTNQSVNGRSIKWVKQHSHKLSKQK